MQCRGADQNERQSHHDRAQNAPEKHAILVFERRGEESEEHCEDKDVVHRQRPFEQVASQKFNSDHRPTPYPEKDVKAGRDRHPNNGRAGGLLKGGLVRRAVKNHQIDGEKREHEAAKSQPVPKRHIGGLSEDHERNAGKTGKDGF